MITPQQIEEVSFNRATFGGYDMQSVDEFLEPLTEDYVTLYKENALLKSKMRVLVGKLEEYRNNEASIKEAMRSTQASCDQMVRDTEAKCARMLQEANRTAASGAMDAASFIESENARVLEARQLATDKLLSLESQLRGCLEILERVRMENLPQEPVFPVYEEPPIPGVEPEDTAASKADAVADEISQSLEAMMGALEDHAPKAEPQHPEEASTNKFSNLKFGRNAE